MSGMSLTPREIECMHGIMRGLTAKEIAITLNISYRTVELHINNIRKKLGSKNKAEAVKDFLKDYLTLDVNNKGEDNNENM